MKRVVIAILLFIISGVVAILDEMDIQFGVWEPDFIDQFGTAYLYIGIAVAAVFLVGVILYIKNRTAKAAPSHQGSK